ncbi:MAG TPA: crossover junction endodeoxyribonuclease RuvC [Bacteroidales bacterium]|nr:crossover junction endodeoxyribonuclease RuvC [Bacteroidales bacterium]
MVILGIDPGTTIMGYGVIRVENNQPLLLLIGTLDQRKICDHYEKISRIFECTEQLINDYRPSAMAIESPFYGNNVQSMLKLGRAQGAAISAALHLSVPVFEYAPRKIKQSITGHGDSSKEQIANLLQLILKTELRPESLDATDGLAAAMCHYYQLCNPVKVSSSSGKGWEDFIKKNPGRVRD